MTGICALGSCAASTSTSGASSNGHRRRHAIGLVLISVIGRPLEEAHRSIVLVLFPHLGYRRPMLDPDDKLTPADPEDLARGLAFALQFEGAQALA